MAKHALTFVFLFCAIALKAQINPLINQGKDLQISSKKYLENSSFTAFKVHSYDSLSGEHFLLNKKNKSWDIHISPALELQSFSSLADQLPTVGMGGYSRIQFKNRLKIGLDWIYYSAKLPDYQNEFTELNKVYPGASIVRNQGSRKEFNYSNFFLEFKANKYFTLSAGYGRQFIGDGYRSLLRSDYQNASPFLKLKTKFWNIEYTNLYEMHQDIYNVEYDRNDFRQKFITSHFLDWKASSWLSLGLFETVIWQQNDGQFSRGFDPNYLNPFIFLRPIEFSTGSSDNVIVGSNIKFTVSKRQILYTQILLDEFLLAELRADFNQFRNPDKNIQSAWWANKYALQFGWRSIHLLGIEGLESRIEYNMSRPFTYAHSSPVQSYSNFNRSLAHPLGANFEEYIIFIQYLNHGWCFKAFFNHHKQGISLAGTNYGDNVLLSNSSRIKEYENSMLQGEVDAVSFIDISGSRQIYKETNTFLQLGVQNRSFNYQNDTSEDFFFYLKLTSNLHKTYFDF